MRTRWDWRNYILYAYDLYEPCYITYIRFVKGYFEKIEETNDFTSAISAYNLKSITDYNDFKTKANISLENNYEDNFSKQNNILAISFKGSAITNSKAIKFKIDNNLTKITIGVENDFILTGKADKDENTYTYYLFPYSSNNEIENIAITFKKI